MNVFPRVDGELLAEIKEKPIGHYVTYYNARNRNRSHNIRLAAAAINNTVLFPGETFSFNAVVGKRTKEKGYLQAPIIVRGELAEGIGGGICQVSSTLFNATDRAGLYIVKRYSHSRNVPYVRPGRDATVSWDGPDFVFQNRYNQPILIRAQAVPGKFSWPSIPPTSSNTSRARCRTCHSASCGRRFPPPMTRITGIQAAGNQVTYIRPFARPPSKRRMRRAPILLRERSIPMTQVNGAAAGSKRALRKVFWAAGFGWMFDAMDVGLLSFILVALRKEWGLSAQDAGLLGTVNLVGMAIGAVLGGYLADRFGRRPVFLYTLVVFGAFSFGSAFAGGLGVMLALRFLMGVGLGADCWSLRPSSTNSPRPRREAGWSCCWKVSGPPAGFWPPCSRIS